MYSATAQMISQNQHTAAAIAAKVTQTEGVEYSVVKETKGFRVVKTGKPTLAMKMLVDAPLVSASTAPKLTCAPAGIIRTPCRSARCACGWHVRGRF